uniref:Uncharacterized protein n=1 Tax=Cacopsylla melanoneura TaxID=428564 RepID=A0A8D8WY39_9HEMI
MMRRLNYRTSVSYCSWMRGRCCSGRHPGLAGIRTEPLCHRLTHLSPRRMRLLISKSLKSLLKTFWWIWTGCLSIRRHRNNLNKKAVYRSGVCAQSWCGVAPM